MKQNYNKLCEKSHRTLNVFVAIANEMELLGYNFAPTSEAALKKGEEGWRNLCSIRKAYIAKISATGSNIYVLKRKPYYDEMEQILGRLIKDLSLRLCLNNIYDII
jgi:hypothetical protein